MSFPSGCLPSFDGAMAAKAPGVTVPPSILLRADEVIE
jgi:hypothetical protein